MAVEEYPPGSEFPGTIGKTIDESSPAWPAPNRAREGAPTGSYLIQATGGINNNGAAVPWSALDCTLTAGSSSYEVGDIYFPADGVGDSERANWMLTHTFDAAGTVDLSCTTTSAWAGGNMFNPTITALSVQSATANVVVATAGVSDGQS